MSLCESCRRGLRRSDYSVSADLRREGKVHFLHLECCSSDELGRYLQANAQRELEFYREAMTVAENPIPASIASFEQKYGDYDEIVSGTPRDRHLDVAAVVTELKRRFAKRQ